MMLSIRRAVESPGLPELSSSPSAANGPCLAQVEGKGLWGCSGVFPDLTHAHRHGLCCLAVSLTCFYNKDNSASSCHFSSLSPAGGTHQSPLQIYTACPLGNKQVQRPLGCTSCCKYPVKMLDPTRKSMVWGSVRRDQGSGSLQINMGSWVNHFTALSALFSCL